MRLVNLLSEPQQSILETLEGWTLASGPVASEENPTGAVVEAFATARQYRYTPGALQLTVTSFGDTNTDVEVFTDPKVSVIAGRNYRAFCWVKPEGAVTVRLSIRFYDAANEEIADSELATEPVHFLGEYRRWRLVSIEGRAPANAVYAEVHVVVPAALNDAPCTVYVDDIVFMLYKHPWDPFFLLCAPHFPEYVLQTDFVQVGPTQPLMRYLAVGISEAERIFKAAIAFDRAPASDGVSETYQSCSLVDPSAYPQADVAEPRWLPWLAQVTGVINVNANSAGSTTSWSTLEKKLASWNAIEYTVDAPASLEFAFDDGSLVSIERDGSGVVTATVNDSTGILVGQSVVVANTVEWLGEFTVASVDGNAVTWNHPGSVTESTSGPLTLSFTDTEWSELETFDPDFFDSTGVLAHLIRTGGTGLWAGTFEGVRRAVRSILEAAEVDATIERDGSGMLSIVFDRPMPVVEGDELDIYLCDDATFDGRITVASVDSGFLSITASQDGPAGRQRAIVSQRLVEVEVEDPIANPFVLTVRTVQSQSPDVAVILAAAELAKPAGWSVSHENLV